MPVRRLDDAGLTAVAAAISDPGVLLRYRAKVATVPASECLWWTGAVAGRSEREQLAKQPKPLSSACRLQPDRSQQQKTNYGAVY